MDNRRYEVAKEVFAEISEILKLKMNKKEQIERALPEVAREIFAEIEEILTQTYVNYIYGEIDLSYSQKDIVMHFTKDIGILFYELKKKYGVIEG